MTLLKDNQNKINSIKGKLASIVSELHEIESEKAVLLTDWLLEKAKYFKKHIKKERFNKLPNKMQRGDIVWVQFGMNIGDELSDDGTDGHFALIWGQQGFMFIVIPLSKQPRVDNYTVDLGKVEGLPENGSTYAKLDNIRSISIRRIRRIREQPDGKVTISDPAIIQKIKDAMTKVLINN